ncbi:MAG: hypothetical protein ACI4PG_06165 [Candidatus Ventricola sp.]
MGRTTISTTSYKSNSTSSSQSVSQSQSQSQSQSETRKVLDERLRDEILAGLLGRMTDEEMQTYAQNLLQPTLNAGLEAAQQQYETTRLGKEQEIERLTSALKESIEQQERAYARSAADVQTAALARGMGRSSYALQTLAGEGREHARTVERLTRESDERKAQLQAQITQAARQNAQTQGRLNTDYASTLAAKVQELKDQQRRDWNSQYLTAVSGSMGTQTTGSTSTTGSGTTNTTGTSRTGGSSTTVTSSVGGGSKKTSAKTSDQVDAVSSAAPSVRRR